MKKIIFLLGLFSVADISAQTVKKVEAENIQKLDVSSPLSIEQISYYNQYFQKFVAALKASDKNLVSSLISEKMRKMVNDNIIQKLSGGISFDKKPVVHESGYESLLDGMSYPAIVYKYENDKSVSPKDLITVIFEKDGKILGVKPNYSK